MLNPELRDRLKTAGVLIVATLALLALVALFPWARWLVGIIILALSAIVSWELCSLSSVDLAVADRYSVRRLLSLTALVLPSVVVFTGMAIMPSSGAEALLFGVGLSFTLVMMILAFFVERELAKAEQQALVLFVGLLIIGFGSASLLALGLHASSVALLLWLMLTVFLNDTAAYFVGRRLKGPKLAPHLSPNKTFSGAAAGLLVGVLVGMSGSPLILRGIKFALQSDILVLSLMVVIAAQMGDLSKSLIKRSSGVKDMSGLLPGHGGLLDRVDGLLAGALILYPWVLLYT